MTSPWTWARRSTSSAPPKPSRRRPRWLPSSSRPEAPSARRSSGSRVTRFPRVCRRWSWARIPCEEFLPGPCLADDQGARVAVWQESCRPGQILLDGLALAHDGGERVRVTVRPPSGPRPGGVDRGGDRVPEYLEIVREGEVVARTVGHELHGGAPPGIRAHDQRRHTRGNRVTLEPLDRLALGASGRDDDGSHLGRRRDGFGGADEVDRRTQVQGEVTPESLECLRQGDHAQSRHGN